MPVAEVEEVIQLHQVKLLAEQAEEESTSLKDLFVIDLLTTF